MRIKGMVNVTLGTALVLLSCGVASANLLSGGNWDFEAPDVPGATNAWVTYAVGSTIGSWTVIGSGGVNVAQVNENTLWPGNPSQFLDLTGVTGGGGIAWSNIATTAGLLYEATWSAYNYSTVRSDDVFTFQATGGSLVVYDLPARTGATFTYQFTASSPLTTIIFKENTGLDSNAGWIDNVTVVLVPEPGMLSLAGLATALFAVWFSRRRRVG